MQAKKDAGEKLGRPRASAYKERKIRKLAAEGQSKRAIRRMTGYGMSLIQRVLGRTENGESGATSQAA